MKGDENLGQTTQEALATLHEDIRKALNEHLSPNISKWDFMKESLDRMNEYSTFSSISALFVFLTGFSLILASFFIDSPLYGTLIIHGLLVIAIGILNVFLVIWDNGLRQNEIPDRIKNLLQFINECKDKCEWRHDNYPHLCSPYSPCITLQWTYRDGKLVNLPWALLSRGDVIVLRPGQPAPGNCLHLDNSGMFLSSGEVYSPPQKHDHISMPTARIPFSNKRFVLQETPLIRNVNEVLEASKKKNITCYDKQRHLLMSHCLQYFALPFFFIITILVNLLHYIYVGQWIGTGNWSVMFLLIPASVALPFLPLCFPAYWILLQTLGNAKLSAFLQSNSATKCEIPDFQSSDPFEDISIEGEEEFGVGVKWGQHFLHALFGSQHLLALTRSSNPLHVLGSVTALCCVDKKGILSWPNPTAEKIFFLKTSHVKSSGPSQNTSGDVNTDDNDVFEEDPPEQNEKRLSKLETCTTVEVLDLTHDLSSPFKLEFDDTKWQEHLGSLKPIGIAILLNTCNMATQEHYIQFCSHVTCEALYNEDLVPVTNRRCPPCVKEVATMFSNNKCLCELPKQIGFTENAKNTYTLLEQLSTFRHVQPETVRRDIKFARSLALATKLKLPFPHMVAVVVSEANAPNSLQLFSQATGDIALDSCVDFWDGTTLRALSSSDRKKILDFYQRTSLTAYCTAFAYRPLGKSINSKLSHVYMELPADSHYLYVKNRSPTPLDWDLHQSTDSLFGTELIDGEVSDIEGCFEIQCNQIFLGMVTMQYQAQIEMVQLIEQLERACIRFVHFSKENELRSRVFSEKMGLESGWNCHISLLSSETPIEASIEELSLKEDDDWAPADVKSPLLENNLCGSLEGSRNMSVSAPCAINSEIGKEPEPAQISKEDIRASQEGWQSLSCLTDSTEQSAPINFDMSNRAKLPRGIEQIRPHLEQVDNVPLLVSLFTDCTPSTTQEMIGIMQEYGETVCVLGSSANADNSTVFLQANVSVSVEPLYPQVCQKVPVYNLPTDMISPTQLSQRLNSLPCCVTITRQRPISLFHLIMQARHFMKCLWNCIQFWICSVFTISFLQVISTLVMLPPIFSVGQIIWLCCVVIPILASSLVHSPVTAQIMQRPGSKSQLSLNTEVAIFVLWCYGTKFLPTILLIPLVFGATLSSNCQNLISRNTTKINSCTIVYPLPTSPLGGWEQFYEPLSNAQIFASTLVTLHLVMVSVSFVHRDNLCWRRSPFRNKIWLYAAALLLFFQSFYATIAFVFDDAEKYDLEMPTIALVIASVSPLIVFLVNEFVKWQEIKANLRYEKRARLDFGTKLGMNSPF